MVTSEIPKIQHHTVCNFTGIDLNVFSLVTTAKMKRNYWIGPGILLFTCIANIAIAHFSPAEDRTLNYRIVHFAIKDESPKATVQKMEIAEGRFYNNDSFAAHIVVSGTYDKNNTIFTVPAFGKQYTWRIQGTGRKSASAPLHHFSTGTCPWIDSNFARFRVSISTAQFKDAYVVLDGTGVIYDMRGEPIWYLPNIDSGAYETREIRDLKPTPQGTLTLLLNNNKPGTANTKAIEVNYDGEVLWTAPDNGTISGEKTEHYHHEFCRLQNGNYMVLGDEYRRWQLPVQDSNLLTAVAAKVSRDDNNLLSQLLEFGNIIEYDKTGKVVWSWRSEEYARQSDLYVRRTPEGLFNIGKTSAPKPNINDMHANAFYFDEKSGVIYVSFRNINRVVKLAYPSGKVLNTFGEGFASGALETGNTLFCCQHSCRISADGNLYLYNNGCSAGAMDKIEILKEDDKENLHLKKVWEYQCISNSKEASASGRAVSLKAMSSPGIPAQRTASRAFSAPAKQVELTSGGGVAELSNGAIFVSMCIPYNDLFIVSREKEIFWRGYAEKYNTTYKTWNGVSSYRCHIIESRAGFEQIVRNSAH